MTTLAEMIESELAPIRAELEQRAEAVRADITAVEARADELELGNHIAEAFFRAGGHPSGRDYIVLEARKSFELKDGRAVARGLFSALRPWEALSLAEWLEAAKKTHAIAFEKPTNRTRPLKPLYSVNDVKRKRGRT